MANFKGIDWIELSMTWDLLGGAPYDDDKIAQNTKDHLEVIASKAESYPENKEYQEELKTTANDIREFLQLLAQRKDYDSKVFQAISEVEDDVTLLNLTIANLHLMWH